MPDGKLTINPSGLVWGLGTVLGPVVGGGFELYTWRWAFYINLLFGAILLPTYLFAIPSNDPLPGTSRWRKLASFDWVGTVLSVGAFTTLVMAINFGGTLYPWNSGQTIALFIVSGALWIIFGLQQGFEIAASMESFTEPPICSEGASLTLYLLCSSWCCVLHQRLLHPYLFPVHPRRQRDQIRRPPTPVHIPANHYHSD